MKRPPLLLLSFLLCLSSNLLAANMDYCVDNVNGNDNNNGKSKNTAWKTLGKLNTMTFGPGDHIRLKRGESFDGYLYLQQRKC